MGAIILRKFFRDSSGREVVDTRACFGDWADAWEAFDYVETHPDQLDRFDRFGSNLPLVRAELVSRFGEVHGRYTRAPHGAD